MGRCIVKLMTTYSEHRGFQLLPKLDIVLRADHLTAISQCSPTGLTESQPTISKTQNTVRREDWVLASDNRG